MRFLRRHQYLLSTVAVLVFASVMVLRQFLANEAAHVERREDFLLLHERGQIEPCNRFYESLIQELPDLSDRVLVEDLHRTTFVLNTNPPSMDNFVWRYQASLKRELQQRSERRLEAIGYGEKP